MKEIVPKLFYASPTGDDKASAKIVIVENEGSDAKVYYLTGKQIINLTLFLFRSFINLLEKE